ncbi:MAG TPA: alpha/beta fold hydrolase [Flavisolibacter sp.]
MTIVKNSTIEGADGRPILLDILYKSERQVPIVIYAHRFNGFKDWDHFDLIANQFAEAGFCFVKFNFSHGGTSPQHPEEFVDPEAYGHNNYSKELYDLQAVINWTLNDGNPHKKAIDAARLYLLGHSRGGGVVLLKAAEEPGIKAVATWASVSQSKTPWGAWPPERMEKWKKSGVEYYTNSRTKQQMPLYYQLYEDYRRNEKRLDIIAAAKRLTIPLLICHGTSDEAVPVANAYQLQEAAQNAELFLLPSDHVFGRKHPWTAPHLPESTQAVVDRTIAFFQTVAGNSLV